MAYNDFHKIEEEKHALEEYIHSVLSNHEKSFEVKKDYTIYENPEDKRNILGL